LSQLARRHGELNSAQPTYLFCKAGCRSLKAVQFLKQHGYSQVKSVRGGITAWIEAGGPTVNA
jgi:rhodanese-related sulfurtransferase